MSDEPTKGEEGAEPHEDPEVEGASDAGSNGGSPDEESEASEPSPS